MGSSSIEAIEATECFRKERRKEGKLEMAAENRKLDDAWVEYHVDSNNIIEV